MRGSSLAKALRTRRAPIPRPQNRDHGDRQSPAEKEDKLQKQNRVSMDGIVDMDAHSPSFSFPFVLGHSCSGYRHSFRAPTEGHRHCCQRWSWRTKDRQPSTTRGKSRITVTHVTRTPQSHHRLAHKQHSTHHGLSTRSPERPRSYKQNISLQSQAMGGTRGSIGIDEMTERRPECPSNGPFPSSHVTPGGRVAGK